MVDFAELRQSRNYVLSSLNEADAERVLPFLSRTELKLHQQLHDADHPLENVHFIEQGMISLLTVASAGAFQVETAVVGSEGLCGMQAFHRVPVASDRAVVQAPGYAYSMTAESLEQVSDDAPSLRRSLHRYAFALNSLTAHASACNRRHTAEQRMARWLLLAHDRVVSDSLPLTHKFLAQMLGVRRSTVTIIAEELRRHGAIDYTRGRVAIRDRGKLETLSCECYAAIVKSFATAEIRTPRAANGVPYTLPSGTPGSLRISNV